MTTQPAEGKVLGWVIYDLETLERTVWCNTRAEARELVDDFEGCVICAVRVAH
jgi:hypothetical protein